MTSFYVENYSVYNNTSQLNYSEDGFAVPNRYKVIDAVPDGVPGFRVSNNYPLTLQNKSNNILLTNMSFITNLHFSDDSYTLCFLGTLLTSATLEVYSIPYKGPQVTLTKLSVPHYGFLVDYTNYYKISPDSTNVAYISDVTASDNFDLYIVPITGPNTSSVKQSLNGGLQPNFDYKFSDNGSYVVYTTAGGLYANTSLLTSGTIGQFALTKDSSTVAYLSGSSPNVYLYKIPIVGGSASTITTPNVQDFIFADNDAYVVYKKTNNLFSQNLNTNTTAQLNAAFPTHAYANITSNIVYTTNANIYSVPVTGGSSATLNNTSLTSGVSDNFLTTSQKVVFLIGEISSPSVFDIWSNNITGGTSVQLSKTLVSGGNISNFVLSPGESYIIFYGYIDNLSSIQLYSVSIEGGTNYFLGNIDTSNSNGLVLTDTNVYFISSDAPYGIIQTDYIGSKNIQVGKVPVTGGVITELCISSDKKKLAYAGNIDFVSTYQLYDLLL